MHAIIATYGISAFFGIFQYLYKGGTATFNITLNRMTLLLTGTSATLLFWPAFDGKPVRTHQWAALGIVFVAIGFMSWASHRRRSEDGALI